MGKLWSEEVRVTVIHFLDHESTSKTRHMILGPDHPSTLCTLLDLKLTNRPLFHRHHAFHRTTVVLLSRCNRAQHVPWEMTNIITILAKPSITSTCYRSVFQRPTSACSQPFSRICIPVRPLLIMLRQPPIKPDMIQLCWPSR